MQDLHLKTYMAKEWFHDDEKINIHQKVERSDEPLHNHEFIELVYIRDGQGFHSIGGHKYLVSAGDLLFINYNQTHSFHANPFMKFVNFLFTPEFISRELMNSENIGDVFAFTLSSEFGGGLEHTAPVARFRGKEFMEAESIVERMLAEYTQKEPGYQSILKGYMQILFGMMVRSIRAQESENPYVSIGRITPDILRYIDSNLFEKINLRDLAEKCFYSPIYFSRLFKETCGKTLTSYIKEKRIHEAVRLLMDTDKTVSEIAERVGYSDRKQFYKAFRQQTGKTPAEFRKKNTTNPLE